MDRILIIIACIIVFMFWLGCSVAPLGKVVNEDVSKSYYYNKSKTKIIYCQGGNWFAIGHTTIEDADVETFQPITTLIAKDKNFVFYQATKQPAVDLKTFVFENKVMKDANYVYYADASSYSNPILKIIPKAKPNSFSYHTQYENWAKDDAYYFFNNNPVNEIDYASFCIVNRCFYYDKNNIYIMPSNYDYTVPKQDLKLVAVQKTTNNIKLINELYVQSNNCIYFVDENFTLAIDKRFKTFVFDTINSVQEVDYSMIKVNNKTLLYKGDNYPINNVDVATFTKLDFIYYKDKNRVYYKDTILVGADAETFEVIKSNQFSHESSSLYAKDKNHVYYVNHPIKGSNPKQFYYDNKKKKWTDGTYYYYNERISKI